MFFQNLDELVIKGDAASPNEERVKLYMEANVDRLQGVNLVCWNYTFNMLREFFSNIPKKISFDKEMYQQFVEYSFQSMNEMGNRFYACENLEKSDYFNISVNGIKPDIVLANYSGKILFVELNHDYHYDNGFCQDSKQRARSVRNEFLKSKIAKLIGANFVVIDTRMKNAEEILLEILNAYNQ